MINFTTDRRSIVKGAAWAVPALSVAAAAPSLAASSVPHDLSTSIPGTGTRASATDLNLSATDFINTGSETVEGLTIVFEADNGQTINDVYVQLFNQPIENVAVGATVTGKGTGTVTLTLAPGTGLGQVTIPAADNYKAPVGQTLKLGSATAFNLSVTVNAANLKAGDVPYMSNNPVPAA